jgi:hypothetical protein
MKSKYKISIPEPCSEDWNKMTPDKNVKFCSVCVKSVVDFTNKSKKEIEEYLIQNREIKICGRFKKSQIDSLTIHIPSNIVYSQTHYHKMFLMALFVAMGTILFSCTDKNGNKQKIDKIEVTNEQKSNTNEMMVGDVKLKHDDSLDNNIPPPPPPNKPVKFVKPKAIQCGETTSKKETIIEDEIYNGGIAFEIDPEYDGGTTKFYNYFKKDFKLPSEVIAKNRELKISFIIDRNGSLVDIKLIQDFDFKIEQEIIRVLKNSKKWKPGEQNGKKTITRNLLSLEIQGDSISKINLTKY